MSITREDKLHDAARRLAGININSAAARRTIARMDWSDYWPEIDRNLILTGRIVGSEQGYYNYCNEAMISEDEAAAGGWEIDRSEGYANPA